MLIEKHPAFPCSFLDLLLESGYEQHPYRYGKKLLTPTRKALPFPYSEASLCDMLNAAVQYELLSLLPGDTWSITFWNDSKEGEEESLMKVSHWLEINCT